MIKVLIVDDSALVRKALTEMLQSASDIEVVGAAGDPFIARDKIVKLEPDVITLDIEMPKMDGLTFLDKLMKFKPLPVVMISSLTKAGAESTLKALSLGAVDYVAKPGGSLGIGLAELAAEVVAKVRAAARAKVHPGRALPPIEVERKLLIDDVVPRQAKALGADEAIICLGASTGGTVALERLLMALPAQMPGIAIVQHMPKGFTHSFAQRLDSLCALEVVEGEPGMALSAGRVIIAPGGQHMLLQRRAGSYSVDIKEAPPVNRHRPSVDVLFRSAVNTAGRHVIAAILTGMGDDGARGLKDLHDAGAFTIAQDEESSVVFGMPKEAIALGAAERVLPLDQIPHVLVERARLNARWGQPRGAI